ncbi:MAG: hypothetical protein P4L33_08635 [Capsulimonadaceae bacterium]|nr:hypothetical protein [Capsulimonadaceae bacterium]
MRSGKLAMPLLVAFCMLAAITFAGCSQGPKSPASPEAKSQTMPRFTVKGNPNVLPGQSGALPPASPH